MFEFVDNASCTIIDHCIPFPWKLHEMLEAAETEGFRTIVSWLPDESSFRVHHADLFASEVMPRYFNGTKYKSFQRQLNIYGFERIRLGPGFGAYKHTFFVRGKPSLCRHMIRVKIKKRGISTRTAYSLENRTKTQDRKVKKPKAFTELKPTRPEVQVQPSCFSQSNDCKEANCPKFDEFKYVLLGFSLGCH
jgi:hypothetical protein